MCTLLAAYAVHYLSLGFIQLMKTLFNTIDMQTLGLINPLLKRDKTTGKAQSDSRSFLPAAKTVSVESFGQ